MTKSIKRHNHYVPEMYLNNWAHDKKIFTYQLLTSHPDVPVWNPTAIKNTASMNNLYVRQSEGIETHDFEDFFMRDYETPAKDPLIKACTNQRMSSEDWWKLIEFVAAQAVRTPACFFKIHGIIGEAMPSIIDTIATNFSKITVDDLNKRPKKNKNDELIPVVAYIPDSRHNTLKIETVNGKSMWFRSVKYLLSESPILHQHKWSIISAAEGVKWPTSDDPVICLNHISPNQYDFRGKWGQSGTELIMPISPTKALYTQVGSKQSPRIDLDREQSYMIKTIIVQHAFMYVFASEKDEEIPAIRPRVVNLEEYERVKKELEEWYDNYQEKEVPFLRTKTQEKM